MILSRHGPVNTATPVQKVEASTIGGIISVGTVVGLMRTFIAPSASPAHC